MAVPRKHQHDGLKLIGTDFGRLVVKELLPVSRWFNIELGIHSKVFLHKAKDWAHATTKT